jgi:hypothetical protein
MDEILSGIYHWTTFHEGIEEYVHSYHIACVTPAVLIDPRVPEEGLEWFGEHTPPAHIYLTNRHHYRHSDQFQNAFELTVWCHRAGLHEFGEGERVTPFEHGDILPGNIMALEVGVLCPEETAFYIPCGSGLLSIGDAIICTNGRLGFVPDYLMGDDPEGVKRGLCEVFHGHLERDFAHLLFAHGEPWINGGKQALRDFLAHI